MLPLILLGLIILTFFSNNFYHRFDLTGDHRYTLSEITKKIVNEVEDPLLIKVYLQGDFPAEFKRLQVETQQHLEELSALNDQIRFQFINPLTKTTELIEKGLQPSKLSVQEDGQVSQAIIFPWAIVEYRGKTANVSLLDDTSAGSQEEQLQNSIQGLEYAFTNAIQKVSREKEKKIAVLRGNGEMEDIYLVSALEALGEYFYLGEFTLDSVQKQPEKTLQDLNNFDLTIIAKPSQAFSEQEKYTLDQYIMQGGKTLWFIDNVYAELDSLMDTGNAVVMNRDLGLTDLLFPYGIRVNYNVTKDLYSNTIRLAAGNTGNQTQFQDFSWKYFPLIFTRDNHPINKSIDPVLLKFPSTLDTLNNAVRKTVLLQSSPYAKIIGTPVEISLNEIAQNEPQESYQDADLIYGVLLEGKFPSAYKNRIKPFSVKNDLSQSEENQMIVISDGDLIANEVLRGEPLPLNKDKWTNKPFGNLDFVLNAAQFMLEDKALIELRSKKVSLQFLDKEKAYQEKEKWQMINLVFPIVLLLLFGGILTFLRKRKYTS